MQSVGNICRIENFGVKMFFFVYLTTFERKIFGGKHLMAYKIFSPNNGFIGVKQMFWRIIFTGIKFWRTNWAFGVKKLLAYKHCLA